MSVIMLLTPILGQIAINTEQDNIFGYAEHIDNATIYECDVAGAISQADLYGIINGHFNALLAGGKLYKKCLVIGYDGARADAIDFRSDNGGINALVENGGHCKISYAGGANVPLPNIQATSTAPGWCSILTGESALKTGVTDNGIVKKADYPSLMTTLATSPKAPNGTSFFTSWDGHFVSENSTYSAEKLNAEEKNINADFVYLENDEAVVNAAINELSDPNGSDFVFAILEGCDHAGHDSSFSYYNPEYQNAFTQCDEYAAQMIDVIDERKLYYFEDWLIIITSDHGGIGTGHGNASMQERLTFVAMNKSF